MTKHSIGHARMSGEQRREQLLDATRAIAVEHGFHAVSIEAVAREAGITRPVVYNHFHDLGSLLEALVDREEGRALVQLANVPPREPADGGVGERIFAAMREFLDAAAAEPATWKLVLMPPEGAPDLLRERVEAGRSAVVARLVDAVGPGSGTGHASPDPELTARVLSATADDLARLMLTEPERYSRERILDHAAWALNLLFPGDVRAGAD